MPTQRTTAGARTTAAESPPPAPSRGSDRHPPAADEHAAASDTADAPPPRAPRPPPPPPLPAPAPGFEERFGTRWVVWVGGLALALGGFFMVRYSIEAGLLGPGVRVFLGGLFALALLGAGEWTRRKESISDIAALPIANIPAILTAAGTAVAFATVYAAYALYGFLVPATAFVLLGIVALGTLAAALLHGPGARRPRRGRRLRRRRSWSPRDKPDYWALYIYLAIVTAAASASRASGCGAGSRSPPSCFAVLWTFPGLDNAARRMSRRTPSMPSRASCSPRCWWSAASCSGPPPRTARSSRSRPARSAPTCSARMLIVLSARMPTSR